MMPRRQVESVGRRKSTTSPPLRESVVSAIDSFDRSIADARDGSYSALGQLLDHYRGYLMRVASEELPAELAGKVAASDVVQDAFLGAARSFPRFQGKTELELRAWLRSMLLNHMQDARRRYSTLGRLPSREVKLDDVDDSRCPGLGLPCSDPAPSSVAVVGETKALIQRALLRLPVDYRRVIQLRSLQELDFEEVGKQLGRSPDAARHLWSRAIQRLAVELHP